MAEASETSEQEDMLERALLPEKERAVLHRLVEHGEATVTLGRIIPVKRYLEPEFWVISLTQSPTLLFSFIVK